ncbi:MAG: hypothetical protein ACQEP2_09390, partial [Actinomycetota bacterium]
MINQNKNISILIAGSPETDTGQRTSTLAEQVNALQNMEIKSVYNNNIDQAKLILNEAKLNKDLATSNVEEFLSVSSDVILVTESNTEIAAEVIFRALFNKKNVVNMNAASEVLIGDYFKNLAENSGVIYSVGAGDEPAVTLNLINYCNKLGLEVICAGKGKNNPLKLYSNPDDFNQKAIELGVSKQGITSFVDGTKTMLEMAILSNASGIPVDEGGMHGPKINLEDLADNLISKNDGGILGKIPAIDYVIGDVAPGVFVIFTSNQKSIVRELNYLKMGQGPYFILYTPYHLGNIEAPLSIYDIAINGKPTINVKDGMITGVAAIAKKDIKTGEELDRIGGYCFAGIAMENSKVKENEYLPLALAENSVARRDIKKGSILRFEDVKVKTDTILYNLYSIQDKAGYK